MIFEHGEENRTYDRCDARDWKTWRISTENRTSRMRGKKMNDLGCLEMCCGINQVRIQSRKVADSRR
jgi:hypothetical protein